MRACRDLRGGGSGPLDLKASFNRSLSGLKSSQGFVMLVERYRAQSLQSGQQLACDVPQARLEVIPDDAAKRTFARWSGLAAETIRYESRSPFEYKFRASSHMLIACQRAIRRAGETRIGGAVKSNRRDIGRTMTLVPAGEEFRAPSCHRCCRIRPTSIWTPGSCP
jgi:hypothetical protein